jgi:hypothetical protein
MYSAVHFVPLCLCASVPFNYTLDSEVSDLDYFSFLPLVMGTAGVFLPGWPIISKLVAYKIIK